MTPPFGFSLFYVKGIATPDTPIPTVCLVSVLIVVFQLIGLAMAAFCPALAIGVVGARG